MPWLRVAVRIRRPDVDRRPDWPGSADAQAYSETFTDGLTAEFEAHGAVAVTVVPDHGAPVLEPAPGATPLQDEALLEGLFPVDVDVAGIKRVLETHGVPIERIEFLEDADWSQTWRTMHEPRRFGDLWIVARDMPVDELPIAAAGQLRQVLRLDPGMAFGTGAHATTALCLDWLATADLSGKSVLDFGCGSGILAIAAMKLGARRVVAVDHDTQAVRAAVDNARENGVDIEVLTAAEFDRQTTMEGSMHGSMDVIVANILAGTLAELAPTLLRCLHERGEVVLSGILTHQSEAVVAAYPELSFGKPIPREEWTLLHGRRTGLDV